MDGELRIELFVADVERAVAFYRDVLGFVEVSATDPRPERDGEPRAYVAVRRGRAMLGFGARAALPPDHPVVAAAGERVGRGVELVLEVDDLDAARTAALAAGATLASDVARRPWGWRDFRLCDPDGFYVRVTEHVTT